MKIKVFSVILSILLVMCMMPSMAFAEGEVPDGTDQEVNLDDITDARDDVTDDVLDEPSEEIEEEQDQEETATEDVQEPEITADESAAADTAEEVAEPGEAVEETAEETVDEVTVENVNEVPEEAVNENAQEPEETIEEPIEESKDEEVKEEGEDQYEYRTELLEKVIKKNQEKDAGEPNGVIVIYKEGKVDTLSSSSKGLENTDSVKTAKSFGKGMSAFKGGQNEAKATLLDQKSILDKAVKDYIIEDTVVFNADYSKIKGPVVNADTVVSLVSSDNYSPEKLAEKLNELDDVEIAEPNYRCYAQGAAGNGTGDPVAKFAYQTQAMNTQVIKDQIPSDSNDEVVVAIIDSGVDYTHEELRDTMWVNPGYGDLDGTYGYDFVDNDDDPMDENGHGSHCAGIIAAKAKNDVGTTGIAGDVPNVKIMALRFLDEDGAGYDMGAIYSYCYIIRAIMDGVNVKAINNSWGGKGTSGVFDKVFDLAGQEGALSLIASNNKGKDNDLVANAPSNEPSDYTVVVNAIDEDMSLAQYSDYGRKNTDVGAPGTNIISSVSYTSYTPYIYSKEQLAKTTSYYGEFDETTVVDENGNVTPTVGTDVNGESNEGAVKPLGTSVMKSSLMHGSKGTMSLSLGEPSSFNYNGDSKADSDSRTLNWTISNASLGDVYLLFFPYEKETGMGVMESYVNVAYRTLNRTNPKSPFPALYVVGDVGYYSEDPETGNVSVDGDPVWSNLLYEILDNYVQEPSYDDIYIASGTYARNTEYVGTYYTNNGIGIMLLAADDWDGDLTISFDSLGVAKRNADPDDFGKYDLYSGTSMATPAASAACALLASVSPNSDALELKAQLLASVKQTDELYNTCSTGGYLDFSGFNAGASSAAIINCLVDLDEETITLKGKNLGSEKGSVYCEHPVSGLTESIDPNDITWSNDQIVIHNAYDLIGAELTFKVTTANGSTCQSSFYTVNGMELYMQTSSFYYDINGGFDIYNFLNIDNRENDDYIDAMKEKYKAGETDVLGELLEYYLPYREITPIVGAQELCFTDLSGSIITLYDPEEDYYDEYDEDWESYESTSVKSLNDESEDDNIPIYEITKSYTPYDYLCGTSNFKRWTEIETSAGIDFTNVEFDVIPVSNAVCYGGVYYQELKLKITGRTIYVLVAIDPEAEDIEQYKVLYDSTISGHPDGLDKIGGYAALTAYNGKLYLIGGSTGGAETEYEHYLNSKTYVLDLSDKKPVWKDSGASFEHADMGIAGGTAIVQNGDLYYVLGYDMAKFASLYEQSDGEVLDGFNYYVYKFDGKNWKAFTEIPPCTRSEYGRFASVGITREGIIVAGMAVDGAGDTFLINTSSGNIQKLNYTNPEDVLKETAFGMSIDDGLHVVLSGYDEYGEDIYNDYEIPIEESGYSTLTYTKSGLGSGTVSGISTYTKGETVPVKVTPKSTSFINAIYVDDNKVCGALDKGKAKTIRVATSKDTHKVKVEFGTYIISKSKVKLGYKTATYNGKNRMPKVTVSLNGKILKKDTDYTVTYSNNRKIGKASVTIKGKGNYIKSKTVTFKIVPKKVEKPALSAGVKKLSVNYKKVAGGVKYKIAYRVKGAKKWKYKTVKSTKATLTALKSGKTYQVKVKAFKVVDGKTYNGKWSKISTAKVK